MNTIKSEMNSGSRDMREVRERESHSKHTLKREGMSLVWSRIVTMGFWQKYNQMVI